VTPGGRRSLVEERTFFAVTDLEVAVEHFELEGAEALTVDFIGGITGGPVRAAALEGAIGLLGAEDLRQELLVVELPLLAADLEEGLGVVVPAVEVAVLVPVERLGSEELVQELDALLDGGGLPWPWFASRGCPRRRGPLIVVRVAIRPAKAAVLRLLASM
jgi:hypothetical protein